MGVLKEAARSVLMAPRKKEYNKRLSDLCNSYDLYLRQQEEELRNKARGECKYTVEVCPLEEGIRNGSADILLFAGKDGVLSPTAEWEIAKAFEDNPKAALLYPDEDTVFAPKTEWEVLQKKGVPLSRRSNPRLKPVYSPETLISYFYFGNVLAVKKEALKEFDYIGGESLYDFALRNIKNFSEENCIHLPVTLYSAFREEGAWPHAFDEGDSLKKADILKSIGMEVSFEKNAFSPEYYSEEDKNRRYPVYPAGGRSLSVIIPSKDNPEVLIRCIESLKISGQPIAVQVIVVDNGSNDENRKKVEEAAERLGFEYYYEKEEFNYSRMNNRGVSHANGELLLFLNDDMEMLSPDALSRMAGQFSLDDVGAVGAKLLYPDSSTIQHIGITNAVDGPVHKFIGRDDTEHMDYFRNRFVHNCIGATGACLMVRSADFETVGGFREDLRIAYNDVDLCFRILELGKHCVIRPDVIFYHYESLSRGADHMSEEKLQRLYKERKMLYTFHPDFYHKDPYEGMAAAGGAELSFDTENSFLKKKPEAECPRLTKTDYHKYPEGIIVHFDRIEKEEFLRCEGEEFYVIQGYHVVPMIDNMRFSFRMVFEGNGGFYEMPMPGYLRMNLEGGYPGATNLKLSGFCNFVTKSELPAGTYKIGIFADDCLKKLYLYQRTGQELEIETE